MNSSKIIEILSAVLRTKHGCTEERSKQYGLIVFRQMKRGLHPKMLCDLWNDESLLSRLVSEGYDN